MSCEHEDRCYALLVETLAHAVLNVPDLVFTSERLSSFIMLQWRILVLIGPLQGHCFIKLPVFHEEGTFRTELEIDGQKLHLLVDTGTVSFHVVAQQYFPEYCQRRSTNCFNLSSGQEREFEHADKREAGTLKKVYHNHAYYLRATEGSVELRPNSSPLQRTIKFRVVFRVRIRNDQEVGGVEPKALLGLGPSRGEQLSFVDRLVESGILGEEERSFTLMFPSSIASHGELTLGMLKPMDREEYGALVYLPISHVPSRHRKWTIGLSCISVSDHACARTDRSALLDSGCPFIFGDPEMIDKLIHWIAEHARRQKGEQVIVNSSNYHRLNCNDVAHLPDLRLEFAVSEEGVSNSLKIDGPYLVRRIGGAGKEPLCKLVLEPWTRNYWIIGAPLFRERAVRFDMARGMVGLVLNRGMPHVSASTVPPRKWLFEEVLQAGSKAVSV